MPALNNPKHERFASNLVKGKKGGQGSGMRPVDDSESETWQRRPISQVDIAIHVKSVGPVRHLSADQQAKLKRCSRAARPRLALALAAGMTLRRFNQLSLATQDEIRRAQLWLTCPSRFGPLR